MVRMELKPCPMCGTKVKLFENPPHIYCGECGSITQYSICSVPSHAARLWNTRPLEDVKPDWIELYSKEQNE